MARQLPILAAMFIIAVVAATAATLGTVNLKILVLAIAAIPEGLPIVATKHAGIAEVINNGVSGILVEEYDYLAMAKEMLRVCNSDELVEQLGKAAAKAIQENDLIQNNTEILTQIIEQHKLL